VADLENEDPPVADPPAPVADPPAPEPDPDPEGTVDVGGQKMIPVGAVIEERRARQALKADFDQLSGYVHQVRPYLDFLQANPDLLQQTRQTRSDAAPPKADEINPEALELATTLDLYGADGKPDVVRGQKLLDRIEKTAQSRADQAIGPLQESTARERGNFMYQRALVTKAPDGRGVDRDVLDALWTRTDAKVLATEEGAAGVVAMALGLTVMRGKAPAPNAPAPLAPLHTESPGSRTTSRAPMSTLDQNIAKIRGLNDKDYAERSRGFTPGRASVLED
jgi:hypothetical protein